MENSEDWVVVPTEFPWATRAIFNQHFTSEDDAKTYADDLKKDVYKHSDVTVAEFSKLKFHAEALEGMARKNKPK
jgi:hypothetical protein